MAGIIIFSWESGKVSVTVKQFVTLVNQDWSVRFRNLGKNQSNPRPKGLEVGRVHANETEPQKKGGNRLSGTYVDIAS